MARPGFPTLSKLGFEMPKASGVAQLDNNYEAATWGRRLGNWGRSNAGPNAAMYFASYTLRARAREIVRNHPYGSSATDAYVSNMIGTGIAPKWRISDPDLKAEIQELWSDWIDEADSYGNTDFYGLLAMIARAEFQDGEVLVRFRDRRIEDGLAVPLQLQVLEADYLDYSRTGLLDNGNVMRMGVEFNPIGKRVAYWLLKQHPGDATPFTGSSAIGWSRVPAEDVMHVYRSLRPGQIRGISHFAPIILKLHEIDQISDATLVRVKTANLFAGFIKTGQSEQSDLTSIGTDEGTDSKDQQVIGLEPGLMGYLGDGEEVQFSTPPDVGSGMESFLQSEIRAVAAGWGVTYEQLTGDLRGVNYSSIRAGLLEFRRRIEMLQFSMIVFQVCRPVVRRFITNAFVSGAINLPDFIKYPRKYMRVDWRTPKWDWVDPLKDMLAEKMAVRSGFKARQDVVGEQGYDVEDVDRKQAEDRDRANGLHLFYDTDPAQVNILGKAQPAATASDTTDAGIDGGSDDTSANDNNGPAQTTSAQIERAVILQAVNK